MKIGEYYYIELFSVVYKEALVTFVCVDDTIKSGRSKINRVTIQIKALHIFWI